MLQSKLFYKALKESPKDEKSVNAKLLLRAGFIEKEMAGVYSFLPLGLLVLRKIEKIVREEIEKIGGQEILMTVLQPKSIWQETGRWSKEVAEVMYKIKDGEKEFGLGPTHEEMLTDIVRRKVHSFTELPLYLYQIQTKFRKELRPRSGLLRGREFLMKDLYSFHKNQDDFIKYYKKAKRAYFQIFKRCGLKAILAEASGEGFTKEYTHEFQVLARGGEDTIVFCKKLHFCQNKEIAGSKKFCPLCKKSLETAKSIEVANTFPLGTKYSQSMKAFFSDEEGRKQPIVMGSYGIGISRLMGAVVEVHHDEKGIIWPRQIAPFDFHLIPLGQEAGVKKSALGVLAHLQKKGFSALYDDREEVSAGQKFAEADLLGIANRLVVSRQTLKKGLVELKKRSEAKVKMVKLSSLK